MARVTVEDCVQRVPNHFELVILAAQRSRQLAAGSALLVDRDNDKNPVIALREIAANLVPLDQLRNLVLSSFKQHTQTFDVDQELATVYDEEQERQFEESLLAEAAVAEMVSVGEEDEGDLEGDLVDETEEPEAE